VDSVRAGRRGRPCGRSGCRLSEGRAGVRTLRVDASVVGMDLLRWFRFCWAAGLNWDQVTRSEAGDFCRWMLTAGKPGTAGGYAPATAAHCETVLRHFYDFHLEGGTGPMVNPFPLGRGRRAAHHNPMDPFPRGASPGCSARGCRSGRPAASRMISSAGCSRGWGRTETGHWSRSGSRPVPARRNCWGRPPATRIRGGR